MDVALRSDLSAYHEAIFECATTAWISADAFLGEQHEFRNPAIESCLDVAAASAALGIGLLKDTGSVMVKEFQEKLERAIGVLDQHCHHAEHCLITLKSWRQTAQLIRGK